MHAGPMALPAQPTLAPMLRVLHLAVTSPAGEPLALHVPWDRTVRDLAHALVAGTDLETPERNVRAFSAAREDLLDTPLRDALRHAENPDGGLTVVLQVEGPLSSYEAVLTCDGVGEPEAHRSYPWPADPAAERRLGAYLAGEEADWFCDGSSAMSCCAAAREAPDQQTWVAI